MIECRKCGKPHFRKHYWCGKCHAEYNKKYKGRTPKKYPTECSHCGKPHDRKHHYCKDCHNKYNRIKYRERQEAKRRAEEAKANGNDT